MCPLNCCKYFLLTIEKQKANKEKVYTSVNVFKYKKYRYPLKCI